MSTDAEKTRISKLLIDLEVPEVKLTQRGLDFVTELRRNYDGAAEEENDVIIEEVYENPYKVDQKALDEIEEQLKILSIQVKQCNKDSVDLSPASLPDTDSTRAWRMSEEQDQISRVDDELKHHHDKGSESISPLAKEQIQTLIKECLERNSNELPITGQRLKAVVEQAKMALPKFQYEKKIENSTALALLPTGSAEQSQ